jgi:hypothetical protein
MGIERLGVTGACLPLDCPQIVGVKRRVAGVNFLVRTDVAGVLRGIRGVFLKCRPIDGVIYHLAVSLIAVIRIISGGLRVRPSVSPSPQIDGVLVSMYVTNRCFRFNAISDLEANGCAGIRSRPRI